MSESNQLNFTKKHLLIERTLYAILAVFIVAFFGRIAFWEYGYYNRMEGTPRAVATNNAESAPLEVEEVDETPITEEARVEYTVPADHPRYISVPKLGIVNARVLPMGITATGELDTPYNIYDAGWYTSSGKPGFGGTLLMDGHNGGPNVIGIFKYLNTLEAGDLLTIERGDGAIFNYRVVENLEISLDEADSYMTTAMTSAVPGQEGLTLISCIGEWSQVRQTYLSRQFLRAVLADS